MRILVFTHARVEHPGVFRDFWAEAGHEWTRVELDAGEPIPRLEPFDALIAMGGPMDVWEDERHPWLEQEKAAVRDWVEGMRRPFLGVCLGHQILAAALGGRVSPMARSEVGLAEAALTPAGRESPLYAGMATSLETFQWHSSEVTRLPEGAVRLAENEACAIQAFAWGERAFGIQYHCEITATTVAEWGELPAYAASLAEALGGEGAKRLGPDVATRLPRFREVARRLNDNFLALAR